MRTHATPTVRGFAMITLLLAGSVVACSTSNVTATGTPAAAAIGMLGGSAQTATIGAPLPIPLRVHVTDQYSNGIAGVPVSFAATGGVTVASSTVTTDSGGNAQTTVTLGTRAGLDSVLATISGYPVPVTFLETATPGAAASIAVVSGASQSGTTGLPLAAPLVVVVMDHIGNVIAGDTVTWTSTIGAASALTSVTAFNGTTQVTFIPGFGANSVTATINGTTLAAIFAETGN